MDTCRTENEYIEKIAPSVQNACKKYGYLPSVMIAQSCLENGYGIPSYWDNDGIKQLLEHNNMLGQKRELLNSTWSDKTVWPGKWFTKETPEEYNGKHVTIKDDFRIYDNIQQSFEDFILFLLYASNDGKKSKYGPEVVNIKDPATLIEAVRSRGYATDSQYSKSVMAIVNKHNLTKYDQIGGDKMSIKTPRFIDNRKASESQVPKWRNKSDIKYIVVHYLGVVGENFELWDGGYGATYTIAWNGDVYWTADYTAVTWQCGGGRQGSGGGSVFGSCTNYNSASIECCVKRTDGQYEGDDNDDNWYFTKETQESLVWAVSKMMDELNIPIENVVRHYDVTGKICPNPYVRNNGKNGNWTWNEFKQKLADYRNGGGKDYLEKGDSGSSVKSMQNMLISLSYSCGSTGADGDFGTNTYKAVKKFQKAIGIKQSGIYNKETKKALRREYKQRVKGMKAKEISVTKLLKSCKNVMDTARTKGYKYGDSRSLPPTDDEKISCDRLIAKALWDLGFKDQRQGGEVVSTLDGYLTAHGWSRSTDPKDIKRGSILLVTHKGATSPGHAFVCVNYDANTWKTNRYDAGSDSRIQNEQPLTNITWDYRKDTVIVFNIPSSEKKSEPKHESFNSIGTATSTIDDLNVRTEPNTSGKILRKLNKGNRFEVDGSTSNSWVHIKVVDQVGWVNGKYIKYD